MPTFMSIQDIQNDMHLQELKEYIIRGWQSIRNEVKQFMRLYWTFRDELTMIEIITIEGKLLSSQHNCKNSLDQLYSNQMGIEKNKTNGGGISIPGKHEHKFRKYHKKLLNMLWIPREIAKG